jgi:hypothetical protein
MLVKGTHGRFPLCREPKKLHDVFKVSETMKLRLGPLAHLLGGKGILGESWCF